MASSRRRWPWLGEAEDECLEHLDTLLGFDISPDGLSRDITGRRCEVAPRPERGELAELWIFLPQLMRRNTLDLFLSTSAAESIGQTRTKRWTWSGWMANSSRCVSDLPDTV